MSGAVSARIGNLIGERKPNAAKVVAYVASILIIIFALCSFIILYLIRFWYGAIYTNDPDVIALISKVMIPLAFACSLGCINGINLTIMRGMGRQITSAIITFPCFYLYSIPLGVYLAFPPYNYGLEGLWWSFGSAQVIIIIVQYIYLLYVVDWEQEVVHSFKKLKISQGNVSNDLIT
jgi:MATE family multidrug resistance protein